MIPRVTRFESQLGDLEPLGTRGIERRAGTATLGHVMHNRSDVVWPLGIASSATDPTNENLAPGIGVGDVRSHGSVHSTVQGRVSGTLDGIDSGDLSNDTRVGSTPRNVALINFPVDGDGS